MFVGMVTPPHTTRPAFPAGLSQPEGSFRFSLDALLLASFTLRGFPAGNGSLHIVDLGCGCGVIGLACLYASGRATAEGLDRETELIAAARENAARLGVADRFSTRFCDVSEENGAFPEKESADVVLANMPYRTEGSGRQPRSFLRRRALFAEAATMPGFMRAARTAIKPDGVFNLVYPWAGRDTLFAGLAAHGFFPESMLPVCTSGEEKSLCLVSARLVSFMAEPVAPRVLPPLLLRKEKGRGYTGEARSFCPWL